MNYLGSLAGMCRKRLGDLNRDWHWNKCDTTRFVRKTTGCTNRDKGAAELRSVH